MVVSPRRAVSMFDSASTMLHATANGLRGQRFPHLGQGATKALLTRLSAAIPPAGRSRLYARRLGVRVADVQNIEQDA